MGTKTNPGNINCLAAALPDEELFILLARDKASPFLTGLWAAIRLGDFSAAQAMFKKEAKKLIQEYIHEPDTEKANEAIDVADRMGRWRFFEMKKIAKSGVPRWRDPEPNHMKDRPTLDPSTFAGMTELIVNTVAGHCDCPEEGGSIGPSLNRAAALADVKIILQGGVPGDGV